MMFSIIYYITKYAQHRIHVMVDSCKSHVHKCVDLTRIYIPSRREGMDAIIQEEEDWAKWFYFVTIWRWWRDMKQAIGLGGQDDFSLQRLAYHVHIEKSLVRPMLFYSRNYRQWNWVQFVLYINSDCRPLVATVA